MDERERYGKGLEVRRALLGDAHVDRTLKNRTPFNDEFPDLITRYALAKEVFAKMDAGK